MDTFTKSRTARSKISAANGRGALIPAGLVGAGISLIVVVGLIHLINFAAGAFAGYVISRTVGLPGLGVETEWLEPLGLLSLLVEALFMGLYVMVSVRPTGDSGVHGKARRN